MSNAHQKCFYKISRQTFVTYSHLAVCNSALPMLCAVWQVACNMLLDRLFTFATTFEWKLEFDDLFDCRSTLPNECVRLQWIILIPVQTAKLLVPGVPNCLLFACSFSDTKLLLLYCVTSVESCPASKTNVLREHRFQVLLIRPVHRVPSINYALKALLCMCGCVYMCVHFSYVVCLTFTHSCPWPWPDISKRLKM